MFVILYPQVRLMVGWLVGRLVDGVYKISWRGRDVTLPTLLLILSPDFSEQDCLFIWHPVSLKTNKLIIIKKIVKEMI